MAQGMTISQRKTVTTVRVSIKVVDIHNTTITIIINYCKGFSESERILPASKQHLEKYYAINLNKQNIGIAHLL